MQSYHNPQVYNIQNPKGLDFAISKLQAKLSALSFLELIYGRAYVQQQQKTAEEKNKPLKRMGTEYFPETWGKNYEPVNCMPNDNVKGMCFFLQRDPGVQASNNAQILPNQLSIRQPISAIFWLNLQKIDRTKKYKYSEELKQLIIYQLTREASFSFDQTYEDLRRVYDPFNITDNVYDKYVKPPYYALRVDGYINYDVLPKCGELTDTPTNIPIPAQYPTINDYMPYRVKLRVGIDTTTGSEVRPNNGTIGPDWLAPDVNLRLNDLLIISDISLGSINYQDVPLNAEGDAFDFTDSAGEVTDGLITFIARKKLVY